MYAYIDRKKKLPGLLKALALNVIVGGLALGLTLHHRKEIKKREGYVIVAFGWLTMVVFGMFPYLDSDSAFKTP